MKKINPTYLSPILSLFYLLTYPLILFSQSVEYEKIKNGEITLAVRLIRPDQAGPHPGVVMVHGSGKGTWDFYQNSAKRLKDLGFAVAYYDKRGVGGSTGEYSGIGITNSVDMFNKLSSDARTVAAWLKDEPGIDKNRIGLFGISQAGWIIPQAAAQSSDIKFCIIVSGPVGSVGEENYFSKIAGDEIEDQIYSDDELEKKLREYGGPHGFDSRTYIRKLDMPVLWIFGAKDKSMPALLSIEYLNEIIESHNKINFSYKVYPDANHGIYDVNTQKRNNYFEEVLKGWTRDQGLINY